jgi:hypothetical protein
MNITKPTTHTTPMTTTPRTPHNQITTTSKTPSLPDAIKIFPNTKITTDKQITNYHTTVRINHKKQQQKIITPQPIPYNL